MKGRTRERRDASLSTLSSSPSHGFRTVTGPRLNFHVSIGGKVKWPLACVRPLIDKSVATLGVSVRASRLRNAPRTAARYSHEKFTRVVDKRRKLQKGEVLLLTNCRRVPLMFLFDLFVDPLLFSLEIILVRSTIRLLASSARNSGRKFLSERNLPWKL